MKTNKSNVFNTLFSHLSEGDILGSDLRHQISLAIHNKRKEMKLSQKEFAKYMGISQSMVSKWESFSYNFSLDHIGNIFNKLDMHIEFNIESYTQKYYIPISYENIPEHLTLNLLKGA